MQIRVRGQRLSLIRNPAPSAGGRATVLASVDVAAARSGAPLPPAALASLTPAETQEAEVVLAAWRREQIAADRRALLTRAADLLGEIANALGDPRAPLPGGLLAAVEAHRLRTLIEAHHELGETLRAHAERHGLLFSPAAQIIRGEMVSDLDEPVVIASDHTDTTTLSEWQVGDLASEEVRRAPSRVRRPARRMR